MSEYGDYTESPLLRTDRWPVELVVTTACRRSPGTGPMGPRAAVEVVSTPETSEAAVGVSVAVAVAVAVAAAPALAVGGLVRQPPSLPLCDLCDGHDDYPTLVVPY